MVIEPSRKVSNNLNQSFNDLKRGRSEWFEHKNDLIPLELSTIALEKYFAESAKNDVNQPSINWMSLHYRTFKECYLNKNFNDIKRTRLKSFEHKNDQIPVELSTVALETYFAESAKIYEKESSIKQMNLRYGIFKQRYLSQSFNDVKGGRSEPFQH